MRVALLSWETLHSISVGGVGAHVTELAAALERKGNEVHDYVDVRSSRLESIHSLQCGKLSPMGWLDRSGCSKKKV